MYTVVAAQRIALPHQIAFFRFIPLHHYIITSSQDAAMCSTKLKHTPFSMQVAVPNRPHTQQVQSRTTLTFHCASAQETRQSLPSGNRSRRCTAQALRSQQHLSCHNWHIHYGAATTTSIEVEAHSNPSRPWRTWCKEGGGG